jgi:5'-methylthioadenosine phosphorylase
MAPGHVVLVDQFVDRTKRGRDHTFFGDGIVAHIAFAEPTCPALRHSLHRLTDHLRAEGELDPGVDVHNGGTYLNMEGPAFSTRAESLLYKSWGIDVVGMTNLAEAKLAREAELCYLTLAMVTDYDCWHETHETVSVEMIIATLMKNAALARKIVAKAIPLLGSGSGGRCDCGRALQHAIITSPDRIPEARRRELEPIVGKYLP